MGRSIIAPLFDPPLSTLSEQYAWGMEGRYGLRSEQVDKRVAFCWWRTRNMIRV